MDEEENIINLSKTLEASKYICDPSLEEMNLNDKEITEEYKRMTPALKRIFREKVNFHTDYQEQFGVTANNRDLIQLQLDKRYPPLPTQIAQEEMMTAPPQNMWRTLM